MFIWAAAGSAKTAAARPRTATVDFIYCSPLVELTRHDPSNRGRALLTLRNSSLRRNSDIPIGRRDNDDREFLRAEVPAAVDVDRRAGDISAGVRAEHRHHARDVVGLACSS